jgi:hypothetical protein
MTNEELEKLVQDSADAWRVKPETTLEPAPAAGERGDALETLVQDAEDAWRTKQDATPAPGRADAAMHRVERTDDQEMVDD